MKNHYPLLSCAHLSKFYPQYRGLLRRKAGVVKALNDVSFQLAEKEILGVIGESGSGKTTLARTLVRLTRPTSGQILFENVDITHLSSAELRAQRKRFQIVFQNPSSSLNPRKTIAQVLQEVIVYHKMADDVTEYAVRMMNKVGLEEKFLERYPHELSIGQQQRVCLARALCTDPKLLVLDECVSSLDISVQAQVLNLLLTLYEESRMSYVFISHDIGVVEHVADSILVMYQGEVVEQGPAEQVLYAPVHPYTKLLLSSRLATRPL